MTAIDDAPTAAEPARDTAAATQRAGLLSLAGPRLAALLLGAACVAWSAAPLGHGGWPTVALTVAIVAVTAGGLRLALADVPEPDDVYLLSGSMRAWLNFLALLRTLAWEEIAVAAVLWLEVQHPARPWHTAALGAGLTAYLLITHIAEVGGRPGPDAPPPCEAAGPRRLPARAGGRLRDDPRRHPRRGRVPAPRAGRRRRHRRRRPRRPRLGSRGPCPAEATFWPPRHL